MDQLFKTGAAQMSDDGLYRYTLNRSWHENGKRACFIMLNPSTADAEKDDPTIRRCISFARREGFGRLIVVNLFAYRATNPKELLTAEDPIGNPENDHWIARSAALSTLTICAWGAFGNFTDRYKDVRYLLRNFRPHCLGWTKDMIPRHPLYLPKNAPLQEM